MRRVDVPGGGWFDLRDMNELNEDHQIEYLDLADRLRQDKRDLLAALPPENPAVMPDPADEVPVRLTHKDLGPVRDLVEGWLIPDSSYGIPLPKPRPLALVNVIRQELNPYYGALNGDVPNESPASASTSTATSAEAADAPPAPSEPEP